MAAITAGQRGGQSQQGRAVLGVQTTEHRVHDWTFPEWQGKPIAFVGWGNVRGARAIEQLRLVAVEFEMAPLRHAVHILPDIMLAARQAADVSDTTAFAPLEPRLKLLADDLTWWAAALAAARAHEQR